MKVDETVKLSELLNIYGTLLSEKQKNMLQNYVNNDMSLAEIAEIEHISRTAVLDAIQKAKHKLLFLEDELNLYKLKNNLQNAINHNDKECKVIVTKILEDF